MDFGLSDEQEMLRRTARDFLTKHCPPTLVWAMATDARGCPPELWQKMAQLGWMGLAFPEEYGGAGGTLVDLMVLLEEMGRACLPGPFFTAVVLGGMLIKEAGSEEQKANLLPQISNGDLIVTLALLEPGLRYEPSGIEVAAVAEDNGYVLSGTKLFVPDVHLADYIICAARTSDASASSEGVTLFLVKVSGGQAQGVTSTALDTMAGDKQFEVIFDNAHVSRADVLGKVDDGWKPLSKVLQVAALAKCAEAVGAAKKVLEMDVEHGKTRIQFGVPIGSFQAIHHHCANIAVDKDIAEFLTYYAAWLLDQGQDCRKQVSMAKAFVGDAYMRTVVRGHQVLGGAGLVDEHEMPSYSKRAPAVQQFFGSSDFHRELIAKQLGL